MSNASFPAPVIKKFKIKGGNTPGNNYMSKFIKPQMLEELRKLLPECDDYAAHLWIDYLAALRE